MHHSKKSTNNRAISKGAALGLVSMLVGACTYPDLDTDDTEVSDFVFGAVLEVSESTRYEQKEKFTISKQTFKRQKNVKTGDYSIIDERGRRHNCSTRNCRLTAIQVAEELNNAAQQSTAEGGGGGGGGGD